MSHALVKKALVVILCSVILAICFVCLIGKITDPDFFWHLKTGEWIWQHGALPTDDPFTYTLQNHHDKRVQFILTGYWLAELIFYLFYAAGGMYGILLLRVVLLGLLTYAMVIRRKGDSLLYGGLLLAFLTCLLEIFPLERPQVFSFLFFAVLLFLLDRIRDNTSFGGKGIYFFFPALMLVWANTHPGFVLGVAVLAFYLIVEGVKFSHPSLRPMKPPAYKRFALFCIFGIVITLLNPNGFHVFAELNQPAFHTSSNVEYLSTPDAFTTFSAFGIILYWLILLLAVAGLAVNIRNIDITESLLLAGAGYFSFITLRYVPIFLIAALPAVSGFFGGGRLLKPARIFVITITVISGIFFTWDQRANLANVGSGNWINDNLFPVKATDFIRENNLQGNMYNPAYWGGYLMWKLAPERRVFTDGRIIDFSVYKNFLSIARATAVPVAGVPAWKAMLEGYRVAYIVTPFCSLSGGIIPLFSALLNDSEWQPVFIDSNSVIFLKKGPTNPDILGKSALSKEYLVNYSIEVTKSQIAADPRNVQAYITEGDLFMIASSIPEAKEAYETALKIMPFNAAASKRLQLLEKKDAR